MKENNSIRNDFSAIFTGVMGLGSLLESLNTCSENVRSEEIADSEVENLRLPVM